MITNKIKSLLALKGLSFANYARKLNIYPQALNNKSKSENYSIRNLIALGDLTNTKLAYIDEDGKPLITFNSDDITLKVTVK